MPSDLTKIDRLLLVISLLGIIILLVFFFYTPHEVWHREPIAILKTSSTAKRRLSNSLTWTTIKESGQIFLKDTVYIPPKTTATAIFKDNSSLHLEPNTMIQFDEVTEKSLDLVLLKGVAKIEEAVAAPKKSPIKTEDEIPERFWKIPIISYSVKLPKTISKLIKSESQLSNQKEDFINNTQKEYKSIRKTLDSIKDQNEKTLRVIPERKILNIEVKPMEQQIAQKSPPPLLYETQIKKMEKMPLLTDSKKLITTIPLIEPLEIPSHLIKEHLEFSEKLHNYSKRPFNFIRIEPLQLDSRYYEFTNIVEFLLKPIHPISKITLKEKKTNCFEIIWTPIPLKGVSYYLEISRDKNFRFVRSFGLSNHFISLKLNDNSTQYLWRVRAVMEDNSLVSELNSFNIIRSNINIEKSKKEKNTLPEWEVCSKN